MTFSSRDFPTLTHLGLNKHSPSIRSAQMLLNINIKLYTDMGLSTRKNWLSLARRHQRLSVQESQRQQSVTDVITRPSFQKCSQQTHVPLSRWGWPCRPHSYSKKHWRKCPSGAPRTELPFQRSPNLDCAREQRENLEVCFYSSLYAPDDSQLCIVEARYFYF